MMAWLKRDMRVDLGYLPPMLVESDPRPAREQFAERYVFGGWNPQPKFTMRGDLLCFPGDRPLEPLAETQLRQERIILYEHDWVAIVQPDGSFEAARLD